MNQVLVGGMNKMNKSTEATGTEADQVLVGLPLPSLAFCYLVSTTIWALSRFTILMGKPGSCKSSLAYEVMRWFFYYNGFAQYVETENKDAEDLRRSIIGYHFPNVKAIPADSMEEWQRAARGCLRTYVDLCEGKDAQWRQHPLCVAVDTLMGVTTEKSLEKIEDEGCASAGFAQESQLLTRWLRGLKQVLRGQTACFIGINHLKVGMDGMGNQFPVIPGGDQQKYESSLTLEMRRGKNPDLMIRENIYRKHLTIIAAKNCFGGEGRSINVDMYWKTEPEHGNRQVTWFDWYGASVDMLTSLEMGIRKQVLDIVDIQKVQNRGLFWSDTLGIPQDDPQPGWTVGSVLEGRLDLLPAIYALLHIKPQPFFMPGILYAKEKWQEGEYVWNKHLMNQQLYDCWRNSVGITPTCSPHETEPTEQELPA